MLARASRDIAGVVVQALVASSHHSSTCTALRAGHEGERGARFCHVIECSVCVWRVIALLLNAVQLGHCEGITQHIMPQERQGSTLEVTEAQELLE